MDAARPLSICHVTAAYYPYPSGVSEYVHHLARALSERGHHVHILTTAFGHETRVTPGVTRIGRALLIPMNRSVATVPFSWHMSGQVKRFLNSRDFDILHLHGFFPPDISFWALRHSRIANVVTIHTVGFNTNQLAARSFAWIFARFNRKLQGRIAVTRGALEFIQPYLPGDYRIIREGVDIQRFRPSLPPVGLPTDGPRILYVGRLDARKGLPVLIQAYALVRQRVPEARLIVVGKGPLEAQAHSLATKLGVADRISFQGFVPNEILPRYYVSADVYCAPTLGGEAFGIVLLEAMASGIPVIASRITGYNEVVEDGKNGLLILPAAPGTLADTITKVLGDRELRSRLIAGGLRSAESHDWSKVAGEMEAYYYEMLDKKRRQAIG